MRDSKIKNKIVALRNELEVCSLRRLRGWSNIGGKAPAKACRTSRRTR